MRSKNNDHACAFANQAVAKNATTGSNTPDLELRAKVANVDGWLGVIEKAGRVWGTHPIHGNWAEVPHYEQDYNAIIPAVQRWCLRVKDIGEMAEASAYMFTLHIQAETGPCQHGYGPIYPLLSGTARHICVALVATDETAKVLIAGETQ